jgi:hypothetical protein
MREAFAAKRRFEKIADMVAVAIVATVVLAMPGKANSQTGSAPLITIPPAKLPPLPAPRALLPTAVQVLHDSQGAGIAMYGALTGKAASAIGVALAIFANSEAFDPTPSLRLALADDSDRHAQLLFAATVREMPVIGVAVVALNDAGGDVTVFYDDADAFHASFPRMQQALAHSDGVGMAILSPIHLGDGGEIDVLPGWQVTAMGAGSVELEGAQGEFISLGAKMPVYTGDTKFGGAVLQTPCCDPQQAFETLFPQIAAAEQRVGFPRQELTGIVESQPVPALGGGKSAFILANLQLGGDDYVYLALADAIPSLASPWTFTLSGAMAPQPIFAAELPTLLQIWKSYHRGQPVGRDDVWPALQNMSATQELLKSTITTRQTPDYNADPAWDEVIGAVATTKGTQTEIDDSRAQSLVQRLASDTGRSWRIVPLSTLK